MADKMSREAFEEMKRKVREAKEKIIKEQQERIAMEQEDKYLSSPEEEADYKVHKAMASRIKKACRKAGHKKVRVIYSAYDTGPDDLALDNLDAVAVRGKCVLCRKYDPFWDCKRKHRGDTYLSNIVENPTWLQVTVLANDMIRTTGDRHHVFLEGVRPTQTQAKGVRVYDFCMGS